MKKFLNVTGKNEVASAIATAEQLLFKSSILMSAIRKKNDFKFNSGDGEFVAEKLSETDFIIPVHLYRPVNPFTKAIGYYEGGKIYLNSRRLSSLAAAEIAGLLCHEWAHACGFTHGNNFKTKEKIRHSVPYYLSESVSTGVIQ